MSTKQKHATAGTVQKKAEVVVVCALLTISTLRLLDSRFKLLGLACWRVRLSIEALSLKRPFGACRLHERREKRLRRRRGNETPQSLSHVGNAYKWRMIIIIVDMLWTEVRSRNIGNEKKEAGGVAVNGGWVGGSVDKAIIS